MLIVENFIISTQISMASVLNDSHPQYKNTVGFVSKTVDVLPVVK
jgi:hypothetical protein